MILLFAQPMTIFLQMFGNSHFVPHPLRRRQQPRVSPLIPGTGIETVNQIHSTHFASILSEIPPHCGGPNMSRVHSGQDSGLGCAASVQ